MAKDRKKLQHIHSSVFDKQPTPESLELGELAVNNNKGGSFISTKNNDGEVVRFSEDATIVDWIEYKEVFPYSAVVSTPTEQDLLQNKSQLLFKLNQVVPDNTVHASDVNGKNDRHGNPINPISQDGTMDGAGFAVDMDAYVLVGGNPSFSSLTVSCNTTLNGTTKIQGASGNCGSLLDIDVETVETNAVNANTVVSTQTYSGHTFSGTVGETTLNGGQLSTSMSGNTTINSNGNINVASNSGVNISAADNVCISSQKDADLYGLLNTKVGVSCGGDVTLVLGISGSTVNESGDTLNQTFTDAIENITNYDLNGANICISGSTKANFYGTETNVGVDCGGSTATTVNVSGTTINEGGTDLNQTFTNATENITNYDLNGDSICISGATNANIYGATTNLGTDCDGTTTATTVNIIGGTVNIGGDELNIDIENDLCFSSQSAVTVHGSYRTNVGISCDGTSTAATTTIKGNKVIVDAADSNLGLTAKQDILESSENDIAITANNDICETAGNDATFYGVNSTNIGVDCSGSTPSETTNIYGDTEVYINSQVVNIDGDVDIDGDTTINGSLDPSNGLSKELCWKYGPVRDIYSSSETVTPSSARTNGCTNFSANKEFYIPTNIEHMTNYNPNQSDGSGGQGVISFNHPVEVNGTIISNAGIYSSDERLKENIKIISRNDFNKAKRVQTKSFNFKDDPHKTKTYGVIAQEVEAAGLEELVYTRDDGFKAVDYTAFMMLKLSYLEDFCVNLARQNEELKNKIAELENKK